MLPMNLPQYNKNSVTFPKECQSRTVILGFHFPFLTFLCHSLNKCSMETSSLGDCIIIYNHLEFFKGWMSITVNYIKGIYLTQ